LLIGVAPTFWSVLSTQVLIGGTSSVFGPAICAVSLGVVGRAAFDLRQGRNQTFNSAGNVVAAVSRGLLGYFVSNRSIFFFVVVLAVPTILALVLIKPAEIDYEIARGSDNGGKTGQVENVRALLKDHPLVIFLVSAVMFHFANAAMLPLLGERLAKVAAGIFGVVSVLVIADLTRGSGRFNLTLGAISMAVGIGASLSQVIAGSIVHHFGFNAGFLFLAAVAAAAFGILYFFVPETRGESFV
jgi:predicted MFS family arabinose efflux permease